MMGLTKERGPKKRDLSLTSERGSQVWAVGFYNAVGSSKLGEVFSDPCNPTIPASLKFAEGTASMKFLFTDANLGQFANQVSYLDGGPQYSALIDPVGTGDAAPVTGRVERKVQLLQVDIAVRDSRATKTGWIFGTFGWIGPIRGDGFFDNLVPVSLQWANDQGNYSMKMEESWINPVIESKMIGWPERPALGFNGRANGPADNIRSSCLSCHSAARIPRSSKGLLGFSFQIPGDLSDASKVKSHVDTWFNNLQPGEMFDPTNPAGVAALDYSLQIEAATTRMCQACEDGAMSGTTPHICMTSGAYVEQNCRTISIMSAIASQNKRMSVPLPRQ